MELNKFIDEKIINTFKINEKDKEIAQELFQVLDKEDVISYFKGLNDFPSISKYKNLDLYSLNKSNNIKGFIKGANTNFNRLNSIPQNKKLRSIQSAIIDKNVSLDYFLFCHEKFINNKSLMKQNNVDFTERMETIINNGDLTKQDINKMIEGLSDDIEKLKIDSNGHKLMHSIISNKYKFLIDSNTVLLFKECSKQSITKQQLQKSVAPKLAAMREPEEFNDLIINALGFDQVWNKTFLKEKIQDANAEVLFEDETSIYVDISTFEQSNLLGSKMWCLTRDEIHLEDYLYKDYSRLIFKFDLSKDITDPNSYVAALYKNNELVEIYDKNDDMFRDGITFENFDNIKFPNSSKLTIKNKNIKYENMIDNGDLHLELPSFINLINLNRFDLIDKLDCSDIQYHLSGFGFEKITKAIKGLENKEAVNYLINNNPLPRNGMIRDSIYYMFMAAAINTNYSVEDVIQLGTEDRIVTNQIKKLKKYIDENPKGYNKLDATEFFFNENDIEKTKTVLNLFNDEGIKPSHFISSQSLKNLNSEMLSTFIEIEPDFLKQIFELNNKRAIISLSSNNFNKKIENQIIKAIPNNEEFKALIKRRVDILNRNGDSDSAKRLNRWIERPKKKLKMKNS